MLLGKVLHHRRESALRWKRIAAAAIAVQLTARTEALENRRLLTTFYVDTNNPIASDNNTGTFNHPLKTIDHALTLSQNNNATSQSDIICIRGGVYHEQPYIWTSNSGASATNRTIISAYVNPTTHAYEPVYVDAADVTTGTWIQDGTSNRWYLNNFTTQTSGVWVDWSATNDGAGLQQIGGYNGETSADRKITGSGIGDMVAGTYFGDASDSRLYVWLADGSNPNNHTIEYANRARAFYQPGTALAAGGYSYANYIDFKGLKLRHDNVYNTTGQDTGCAIYTANDERLIDCDIQWNAGDGVFLRGTSQMTNCVCSNNGGNGVAAQGNGFLISGGHYNSNFWRLYNTGSNAAIKVITNVPTLYGDIQNIEAANNYGKGIWYDSDFENSVVSHITGNYIHDNQGDGIDLEASRNYLVANNVIANNQADGIQVNAVENAQIYNNTIVGNSGIAAIELDGGTRDQGQTYPGITGTINVNIRNNIIANNFTVYDLDVPTLAAASQYVNNNTSDFNLIYRRGGPLHFTTGGTYLGWGTTPSTLADWQAASGQDAHSVVADPLFVSGGSGASAYMLGSNSPAKDAGTALMTVVTTDFVGTTRPQFAGYDIGAFEFASGGVGTAGPVVTNTDPTVWVDDQLPDNAAMTAPDQTGNTQQNRFWQWNNSTVDSGAASLDSTVVTGTHRQYFTGANARTVAASDVLFAYVWIDPANLPRQIMLEWRDSNGSWNHLAYWGQNLIAGAVDNSTGFQKIGDLPTAGQWTRLQVPAATVGLAGKQITGFSFDVYDGRALLDKIGNGPATQLHGRIFQDNNGNGQFDPGEPVLAGDTVFLDLNNDGADDPGDPTVITNTDGQYTFDVLTSGAYLVRPILPGGFVASTQGGDARLLLVAAGQTYQQDFGGFPTSFSASQNGDSFIVSQSGITNINIWQNAAESTAPTYSIAATQLPQLAFHFRSYNSSLTVDFTNGNPLPATGFSFDGTGSDTLNIVGGNYTFSSDPQPATSAITVNVATGASVTFAAENNFHLAGLNISSGATAVLSNAADVTHPSVLIVSSLISTGTLDLGNNAMVVHSGDLSAISKLLYTGFDLGHWDGIGISSSAANADSSYLTAIGSTTGIAGTFEGQAVSATDVLLKYTYYGDANLDGIVDGSDYSRIDSAFVAPATGWNNGDFNYDGTLNGSDYTLIDNAFNRQTVKLATESVAISTHTVDAATAAVLASASYVTLHPDLYSQMKSVADPSHIHPVKTQKVREKTHRAHNTHSKPHDAAQSYVVLLPG